MLLLRRQRCNDEKLVVLLYTRARCNFMLFGSARWLIYNKINSIVGELNFHAVPSSFSASILQGWSSSTRAEEGRAFAYSALSAVGFALNTCSLIFTCSGCLLRDLLVWCMTNPSAATPVAQRAIMTLV